MSDGKLQIHPSILYVNWEHTELFLHTTIISSGTVFCKQRPKFLGRYWERWSENRTLKGHARLLPLCFIYSKTCGKNLSPPFNIYRGGASIISEGPLGHTVTHPPGKWHSGFKWDMTFAPGISISKRGCVTLQPPSHRLSQEVKLKTQSARATPNNRWEDYFSFVPHRPTLISTSTLTLTSALWRVPASLLQVAVQQIRPSMPPLSALAGNLPLSKGRSIRQCSGQAACASQSCSLLGRPCQTRPAQYAPAKRQSGPSS